MKFKKQTNTQQNYMILRDLVLICLLKKSVSYILSSAIQSAILNYLKGRLLRSKYSLQICEF